MLYLLIAMLCADWNPARPYQIDTCICRGDPLGSRPEGTMKYLAEPRLVTPLGRPVILLAGRAATVLPPGLDMSKEPGVTIEVHPRCGPFGTILLDVDTKVEDDAPGGAKVEHKYRATRLVVPGQRIRFRMSADSPSNQTWAEVVITAYTEAKKIDIFQPGSRFMPGASIPERDEEPGRIHRRMSVRGLGTRLPVAPPPRPVDPKAPRVVELTRDVWGNALVPAMQSMYLEGLTGPGRSVRRQEQVEIGHVNGLKFYDTAGRDVTRADALKALAKGGTVIVCGEKKALPPEIVAAVHPGTLVLVAPDLVIEPDYYGPGEDVP